MPTAWIGILLANVAGQFLMHLASSNASELPKVRVFPMARSSSTEATVWCCLHSLLRNQDISLSGRQRCLPSKCTWTTRTFRPEKVYTKIGMIRWSKYAFNRLFSLIRLRAQIISLRSSLSSPVPSSASVQAICAWFCEFGWNIVSIRHIWSDCEGLESFRCCLVLDLQQSAKSSTCCVAKLTLARSMYLTLAGHIHSS